MCLSISRLVGIWAMFSFWLLEIKLQRTSVYRFLFRHRLSFILGRHLGMEWLGYMVGYVFNFLRNSQLFSNVGSSNSSPLMGPSFPTCETMTKMNTVNLLMSPKVPLCPLLSCCPQPPSDLLYISLQFLEGGVPSNIQYVLILKKSGFFHLAASF